MFFILAKTLDVLLGPLTWAMGLGLLSLLRVRPWFRWLGGASALVLFVFASERVSNALVRHLEMEVPPAVRPDVTYDAAVLLGGLLDHDATVGWGKPQYNDDSERLTATFDLLRTERVRFAVLSGGGNPGDPLNEARVLADQLAGWGIDRSRLVLEEKSRNTRENAVESAKIVRERGFRTLVLVTSAFHMPRAVDCFRAVDLAVDPLPVDYRSFDPAKTTPQLLPRSEKLADSTFALREMAGRLVYRATGRGK